MDVEKRSPTGALHFPRAIGEYKHVVPTLCLLLLAGLSAWFHTPEIVMRHSYLLATAREISVYFLTGAGGRDSAFFPPPPW